MSKPGQLQSTNRFIDIWAYFALVPIALVLFAGVIASSYAEPAGTKTVQAKKGTPVEIKSLSFPPHSIGALQIDVAAGIPINTWATYEIRLLDQNNKILAAAVKQAWAASGKWAEAGESGDWVESDTQAGLNIQASQAESVTLVIEILESDITNELETQLQFPPGDRGQLNRFFEQDKLKARRILEQPISFNVTINNSVIEDSYLWAGFWGTLLIAGLAALSTAVSGFPVINKRRQDSDVHDRAFMGGPDSLVVVRVCVKLDETFPSELTCHLFVRDGNGQTLYDPSLQIKPVPLTDDDDEKYATAQVTQHLVLETRSSYGFYATIEPDNSVDETHLIVTERKKTFGSVDVVQICTP